MGQSVINLDEHAYLYSMLKCKRFFLKRKNIVLLFAVVVLSGFLLMACSSVMEQYQSYIAEFRPDLYTVATPDYSIEVASGYREKDFAIDGVVGDKVDFVIITVVPTQGVKDDDEMSYSLKFDDKEYSGNMTKHPFNESFSSEIAQRTFSKPIVLTLSSKGETVGEFDMKVSSTDEMIDSNRALDIATTKLKSQISSMTHNGSLKGEIYLLFVKNPLDTNDTVYWYVAFVNTSHNTYALLIDPVTEKVLAQHV